MQFLKNIFNKKEMSVADIREKYLQFFSTRKHTLIPSARIVPENDPTTLFTGSGMQPLLPYLLGETHPQGTKLANSQKCFRAEDIEEIGDNRHTTFFEMLGNWSLGDYFKEEQLPYFFEFLTKEVGLDPNRLYVTVFAGDEQNNIPRDEEAAGIWQKLFQGVGIEAKTAHIGGEAAGGERGMKDGERIFYYDATKNWWSRSGAPENMPEGEPGGPDSEVFYEFTDVEHDKAFGEHCHPNCDCGRFMEIGNSVFMEYIKTKDGFDTLPQRNVDFGGGLERIVAVQNGTADVFTIDAFANIIAHLEKASGRKYTGDNADANTKAFRIIADHMRGAVFMIADGVLPSNTEQGYFVRRLLRRAVRYADTLNIAEGQLAETVSIIVEKYEAHYTTLTDKEEAIIGAISREEMQFRKTLEKGLREFKKTVSVSTQWEGDNKTTPRGTFMSPESIFKLITTHGFPRELIVEEAKNQNITITNAYWEKVDDLLKQHKEKSRAGAEQKFKGGLADTGEKTTMYHTATHLLLAGLRKHLGEHVEQRGSNITPERLRFDFSNDEKVSKEKLEQVEQYVRDAIAAKAQVQVREMQKDEARKQGIAGSFWEKYPDIVKVWKIEDENGVVWSEELCNGPHVKNTGDIEGEFKIKKEEASSAGVRRIKAVLLS